MGPGAGEHGGYVVADPLSVYLPIVVAEAASRPALRGDPRHGLAAHRDRRARFGSARG